MADKLVPLPFGIPQLDKLFGYEDPNSEDLLNCLKTTTSVSILGEDGTGKSVFALHLAAMYQAIRHHHFVRCKFPEKFALNSNEKLTICPLNHPFVFYVSSDLKYSAATEIWENFYLDYPWLRYVPFISAEEIQFRRASVDDRRELPICEIKLVDCKPEEVPGYLKEVMQVRLPEQNAPFLAKICFIDLASQTTGDDWLFLTRLVSSVRKRENSPPNLLIVDSVAGFETLVGQRNIFGEKMSRRARIAQLIRASSTNWHTVFVVEEPDQGTHHPEEYVTDTVLHLRRQGAGEKSRRLLEIEKCRARSFASGEHPFEIRDGRGSSTRSWENPDDPYTFIRPEVKELLPSLKSGRRRNFSAYIQLFPSLDYLSKEFARRTSLTTLDLEADEAGRNEKPNAPFGIRYLDNMLAERGRNWRLRGLPQGTITSLIGDEGTRKSALAEQFLVEGFAALPQILDFVLALVRTFPSTSDINIYLRQKGLALGQSSEPHLPEAVRPRVIERLSNWLEKYPGRQNHLKDLFSEGAPNLLSEEQLKNTIQEEATESGHPAVLRPLMRRWDEKRYYEEEDQTRDPDDQHLLRALSVLRTSSGLLAPVVFISTHDTSAEKIAEEVWQQQRSRLLQVIAANGISLSAQTPWAHAIHRLIERFIVVRRVDLTDATGPQLWHMVHASVVEGLLLLGYDVSLLTRVDPVPHAGDVRVVLSDLRVIRDTYPGVAGDPLFLPTLIFRFRRIGVTCLIVDSDNGRPDLAPLHPMNGALRSLVDHQIYTWKVPFFGEERIAISVIPPLERNAAGIVRELKYETRSVRNTGNRSKVDVDPHFELYMGVEEGRPTAVPLEIVLYEETPAFTEYIEVERGLLERIFSSVADKRPVIRVEKTRDYDGLRDYCHLPIDTKLPFTLVFAVDGFWALGRDASLRDESAYLLAGLERDSEIEHPNEPDYVDAFRLFRRTRQEASLNLPLTCRADFFRQAKNGNGQGPQDWFYESRIHCGRGPIDRVPFMWDFGFLLCNATQWRNAFDVDIPFSNRTTENKNVEKVRDVWGQLCRAVDDEEGQPQSQGQAALDPNPNQACEEMSRSDKGSNKNVSWRRFFEACTVVAKVEARRASARILPFDLATAAPESLACLIFEIWFSEIAADALRLRDFAKRERERGHADNRLVEWAFEWAKNALSELDIFSRGDLWVSGTDSGNTASAGVDTKTYLQNLLVRSNNKVASERPLATFSERKISEWYETKRAEENERQKREKETVAMSGDAEAVSIESEMTRFATMQLESPGYSLQLYKTWLLLLEVFDFEKYEDPDKAFELKADYGASVTASASRHWYKTACAATSKLESFRDERGTMNTLVPVRLPGHFSTRGDWFLAVAKGSRSYNLSDRALDLLTSRRANRTRLHLGLGLPTRDILHGSNVQRIRTRLGTLTPEGSHRNVQYGSLLSIGGDYSPDTARPDPTFDHDTFRWLFRSGFIDYDRQARVIRRWIHRLLTWTMRYRSANRASWRDSAGFDAYDAINEGKLREVALFNSFVEFARGLDVFVDDLDSASLFPTHGEPPKRADQEGQSQPSSPPVQPTPAAASAAATGARR